MAVSITNTTITALNAVKAKTFNAATSTVTNGTEVFTLTPTKSGGKLLLEFANTSTSAYTFSIPASTAFTAGAIVSGTVAASGTTAMQFDTMKVMTSAGTIPITLTPSTGLALVAGHAATVAAHELL
jgi:hypothetical protein